MLWKEQVVLYYQAKQAPVIRLKLTHQAFGPLVPLWQAQPLHPGGCIETTSISLKWGAGNSVQAPLK